MDREKWEELKKLHSAMLLERVGDEYRPLFDDAEEIKKYWPHDCPITLSNVDRVITAIVKAGYRVTMVESEPEREQRNAHAYARSRAKQGQKVTTEQDKRRKIKNHHQSIRQNQEGQKNFLGGPGQQKNIFNDAT
jgi:DNA mismatch repair ATPase MutS